MMNSRIYTHTSLLTCFHSYIHSFIHTLVECLQGLTDVIGKSNLDVKNNESTEGAPLPSNSASSSLYLDCLLKLGQWKLAMLDPGAAVDMDTRRSVLALYSKVYTCICMYVCMYVCMHE